MDCLLARDVALYVIRVDERGVAGEREEGNRVGWRHAKKQDIGVDAAL